MSEKPDYVVIGLAAAVRAEYHVSEHVKGKWIVVPVGGDHCWDAEGFASYKAALIDAHDIAKTYGISVAGV